MRDRKLKSNSRRGKKDVDRTQGMIEGIKCLDSLSATSSKLHLCTHLARSDRLELVLLKTNVSCVESKDVG